MKDLLWVEDAANAVVSAVMKRTEGIFNVTSGAGVSVRELAEILRELGGGTCNILIEDDGSPALSQVFINAKAREELGFSPAVSIREGLARLFA